MGFHGHALRAYSLTDQEDKAIFYKIRFFPNFLNHSRFETLLSGQAQQVKNLRKSVKDGDHV